MIFAGLARIVTVLGVGVLGAGCGTSMDGASVRTSPRSSATTSALAQIMPDDAEIRAVVGNDPGQSLGLHVGGIEVLPDGFRSNADASPIDCIGPTYSGLRVVYEKGPVREVTMQNYWNYDLGVTALGSTVAAVRLASAADAQRLFTSFVAQWQTCAGTTVTTHTLDSTKIDWFERITGVESRRAMLSTVIEIWDTNQTPPTRVERAAGVVSDVIVDVNVTLGPRIQTGSRAIDLVKLMMRKLASTN